MDVPEVQDRLLLVLPVQNLLEFPPLLIDDLPEILRFLNRLSGFGIPVGPSLIDVEVPATRLNLMYLIW